MPSPEVIYIQSDNIIEVLGVLNVATGQHINSADVTLTLVDASSGDEIENETWPILLDYVSDSNGDYRGVIRNDVGISQNQSLIAKVKVDGGFGLVRYWERQCIARIGE